MQHYTSGADARRLVEGMKQAPEVLVCDHRMPDTDGASLLERLRLDLGMVPAILISAHLDSDGEAGDPRDPFRGRLRKPFAPAALLALVHAAAQRKAEPAIARDIDTAQAMTST